MSQKKNQKKGNKKNQKEATVEQELPKNPQEYSYRGDEMIEIPASLFLLLYRANEKAIQKGITRDYPTATEWVSAATGMPEPNPKEADIKAGLTTQVMSIAKTFSPGNVQETFAEWIYPEVVQAKEALISIHNKAVEMGVATKITELQAEAREKAQKQAKEIEEMNTKAEESKPSGKK